MLPLFGTFKKEELDKEVDILDISSIQTSVLTKFYPGLGTTKNWDMGVMTATPIDKNDPTKGFITLDLRYQDLFFEEDAYDFDYIKGTNPQDPFYQLTDDEQDSLKKNAEYISEHNYWLVVQCLKVKEWFSNNSKELNNFMCWEYREHIYQQEIYFKHKLIHTDVWVRDTVPGSTQTLNNQATGGLGTPTCNIGAGKTNPTYNLDNEKITTGTSGTFESKNGKCLKWKSLEVPYTLTYNAKNALGAVIKINNPFLITKVYLKSSSDSEEKVEVKSSYKDSNNNWGSFDNPIQLTNQFIEIEIKDPGTNELTNLTINYYGEEYYRIQIPFKYDEEPDYCMHTETTLAISPKGKYHPPQKVDKITEEVYPIFPTNFRLNKEFIPLKKFTRRFTEKF